MHGECFTCPADRYREAQYVLSKSATNCARTYNGTFIDDDSYDYDEYDDSEPSPDVLEHSDFRFSPILSHRQVWDSVVLLCLLEDCAARSTTLDLLHEDDQEERLKKAMHARNIRTQRYGLGQVLHRCRKCVRFFDKRITGEGLCKLFLVTLS